jgi:hypothetical protein
MATLAAASGALDHRFSLKMMQHGNWLVSPRLWVLLVGDPSTKKTPAINAAINELDRIQADELRKHKELRRQYLARGGDAGKFEQEYPSPTRYVIHDSTIEKLGIHLSQQDRGILLKKDEVTGWIGAMEKYASGRGSATDRAFWLQAYDGGFYSVDRVKRDDLIINRLSVSMIGGIQPARLAYKDWHPTAYYSGSCQSS